MEARKSLINDIFNSNRVLEIPFFQRAYVWDIPQWERFIADMESVSAENTPYFLGSVILKQKPTQSGSNPGDRRTVIDGQQRLTTLCIYLKVLSLKLKESYYNFIYRLGRNQEIALLHNQIDSKAFEAVLNLSDLADLEGGDNITRASVYFNENLDPNKIDPQRLLDNLMFVVIDLGIEDDEQKIFDTINSLGVKLTTAELLKKYFFSREDIKQYQQNWYSVFENDNDRDYWDTEINAGRIIRSLLDLFFYSFLQIKIQETGLSVKADDKKRYSKVEGLFDSYKDFIAKYGIDKNGLINEIKEYAGVFRNNFYPDAIEGEIPAEAGMQRINVIIFGLESTTLIPYVLFLLKNAKSPEKLNAILAYLESYIMRRMICHESTKNYNQLFGERFVNNQLLDVAAVRKEIDSQTDKVNFMPIEIAVDDGFNQSRLTNKQAAGILYLLETKIRFPKMHSTAMFGFNKYSLEHIMPKKWEAHWPKVKTDAGRITRDQKLLTLGNLTIIPSALNSSINNADWKTKKNGDGKNKGLSTYAAGLITFSEFLSYDTWDEESIAKRAAFLAKKANEVWEV
jgi:uncharacterized protein with ParB-like and HNH nuclease domain